jgi:hypothetical protein
MVCCGEFRAALRAPCLAYIVIIPCDYRVTKVKDKVIRADEAIAGAVFECRSCGNDTNGPATSFCLCWAPEDRPVTMTYFITIVAGRRWPAVPP